jgi:hypothetical protein
MTISILSGFFLSIVFTFLSIVHFFWTFSGEGVPSYAVPFGNTENKPSRALTMLISIGFLCATFVVLGHIGIFELPLFFEIFRYGIWVVGALFLWRIIGDFRYFGIFKSVKNTKFTVWDNWFYIPLSLLIALLSFLIIFTNTP